MKKKNGQPLGYQQQANSCWITSMMNAMIFLHGQAKKIPNEVARILYAISSKDGTENQEAEKIINFINEYEALRIKCEIYEKDAITEDLLREKINNDEKFVIVADVQAGCHSVLITAIDEKENKIKIFDPDWSTVLEGKGNQYYEVVENEPYFNALVTVEEFFIERTNNKNKANLRMGAVSSRSWIVISKN